MNPNEALVAKARALAMFEVLRAHSAVKLRRQQNEHVGACPVCGTGDDRFSIRPDKELFFCRVCGRGGCGAIDLELFLGGGEFIDAVKRLTGVSQPIGHARRSPAEIAAKEAERAQRHREQAESEADQRAKAKSLWLKSKPAGGTVVETYLRRRGYVDPIPATIRYLPARDAYAAAMIAAFALPNEFEPYTLGPPLDVRAVHITRLLPDGSDRIREEKGKIIVARPCGLPIALSCIGDGLSLAVTEGIEDALAFAQDGYAAWAAGASPFLPALETSIPNFITCILIEQHPDAGARRDCARLQTLLRERPVREITRGKFERSIEILIREAGE
jgi:hypothetical protein